MPRMDSSTLADFLREPHVGVIASLRRDGRPYTVPVWWLHEKYIGRGEPASSGRVEAFFSNMRTEPRMLFRIDPTVRRSIDMRVYEGKRADREHQAGR